MTAYNLILLGVLSTQRRLTLLPLESAKKMPDTRKGDDGVYPYTPRSPDDADGVLWALSHKLFFAEHQNFRF